MDALRLPDPRFAALRQAWTWACLLIAAQALDVVTTAVDDGRGTVESMTVSAHLLHVGGLALLLGEKLLIAAAAAALLRLAALRINQDSAASRITFRFVLIAVQATTIGLVWVCLSNVALLGSL